MALFCHRLSPLPFSRITTSSGQFILIRIRLHFYWRFFLLLLRFNLLFSYSVRRKREASSELITLDGGADALDAVQIVKQPVQTGLKLLANEEFYQEKGSRDSESEEDDHEKGLEQTPDVNKSSKKRNASKKLQGSKYVWNLIFSE